jgi:hypothetical protein
VTVNQIKICFQIWYEIEWIKATYVSNAKLELLRSAHFPNTLKHWFDLRTLRIARWIITKAIWMGWMSSLSTHCSWPYLLHSKAEFLIVRCHNLNNKSFFHLHTIRFFNKRALIIIQVSWINTSAWMNPDSSYAIYSGLVVKCFRFQLGWI